MGVENVTGIGIPDAIVTLQVVAGVQHEGVSEYWQLLTHFLAETGRWQSGWDCNPVLWLLSGPCTFQELSG